MLSKETQELLSKIVENWDVIRAKFVLTKGNKPWEADTLIGNIGWDNPNLIWILSKEKEDGYEGSQFQIGVAKDGSLCWEYQSHCSCNGYEDTSELPEQFTEETKKSFNFTNTVPPTWEKEMCENMTKILNSVE